MKNTKRVTLKNMSEKIQNNLFTFRINWPMYTYFCVYRNYI